jgi:hypothetical protein
MTRIILIYGIMAGLVVTVPLSTAFMIMEGPPENGAFYGYLAMLLALTAVFLGIKRYRDKALGGVIKFVPALMVGLGISAVASLFWVIAWEISLAFSGFNFAEAYTNGMLEAARAEGASETELQKVAADAEAFMKMYANPLVRVPITFVEMFPIGVLISLISAALLRNSRFLPARASAASVAASQERAGR